MDPIEARDIGERANSRNSTLPCETKLTIPFRREQLRAKFSNLQIQGKCREQNIECVRIGGLPGRFELRDASRPY